MVLNLFKKVGSVILVLAIVIGMQVSIPVYAAEDNIEIVLTDVTQDDQTTLLGEAKIKVSVKGAGGSIMAVQTALKFEGDLKYKSIEFLQGENNPPSCAFIPPNAALVNLERNRKLLPSIVTNNAGKLSFTDEETDLFIITFAGNPGDSVTLSLDNDSVAGSYVNADGIYVETADDAEVSATATASSSDNEGVEAIVKLTMDEIDDFQFSNGDGYADSRITLTITNEITGSTISTVLNTVSTIYGGHYYDDGTTSVPVFLIKNIVVGGATYTVELKGNGYVTYKNTGVTFDEAIELTNADFIPGDVNMDGAVDSADKNEFVSILNGEYNDCADFNRDGKVNMYDNVFGEIEVTPDPEPEPEIKTAPAKMGKPSVSGGKKKITVSWSEPDDGGSPVTGYTIKYGTSSSNLNKTETVSASVTTKEITGLSEDTTYYVQIAASNEIGLGEFSATANAKTDAAGGAGGAGGGGGGGGGMTPPATKPEEKPTEPETEPEVEPETKPEEVKPSQPDSSTKEVFTDLGNYAWAKDSIYSLKDKGVISGISETEFAPASNIKRGDFILILTRMLSINDSFTENFADVPAGKYYYNAIGSAKAAGIATGDGLNFMPENTITRQDLITLAYRAFLAKGYIEETDDMSSLDEFEDKDTIAAYAKTAMASMVKAGIIKGADGCVNPRGNATRAEVAVMCARLMELIK